MTRFAVRTLIVLCALALSSLCFLYGALHEVPGASYTGLRGMNASDIHVHISWIDQVRRGRFLLKNEFTAEPHSGVSVRLSYYVLSLPFRFSSVSNIFAYHAERLFCGLVLLLALFRILKTYSLDGQQINVGFLLLAFSSGFGYLLRRWLPASADLSIPESNLFLTLGEGPHFLFSLFFLWTGITSFYSATNGRRNGILLCLACLVVLWWDHPFDAVILIAVCGANLWALPALRSRLVFAGGAGILSIPPFLYYQYLKMQPAFSGWGSAQNLMLSPSVLSLICGLGPLILLAIPGALEMRRNLQRRKLMYFLVCWASVQFVLAYAPFPFQRRLIAGIQFPLAVLSVYGLLRMHRRIVITAILIAASTGSFFVMSDQIRTIRSNGMPFYLPEAYQQAFEWMNHQKDKRSVLSGFVTGNFIPPYTGFQSYVGHSSLTPNIAEKRRRLQAFYKNPDLEFLKENRFQYVFWGAEEHQISGEQKIPGMLTPAYSRHGIYILSPP